MSVAAAERKAAVLKSVSLKRNITLWSELPGMLWRMDHFSNHQDIQGKKRRLPSWKGRGTDSLGDTWQLLWIWLVPIKMRQTPSPSCQKLFQQAKYQQPDDSSAITFQNKRLSLWSLSFSFTVLLVWFFSAATNIVLRGIYAPNDPPHAAPYIHPMKACACLDYCGTARGGAAACSPGFPQVHPRGDRAEGLVVVRTKFVPARHQNGGIHTAAGGSPRTNWLRRTTHRGKVALLFGPRCLSRLHSASQPCWQDERCILCSHDSTSARTPMPQLLSGVLGSLSEMKLFWKRWENFNTLKSLFRATPFLYCIVMKVGMGLPKLPGAKSGGKKRGAPFLSAYKPQVFLLPSVLLLLSAACLRCGFNGALSSFKQELPGIWD